VIANLQSYRLAKPTRLSLGLARIVSVSTVLPWTVARDVVRTKHDCDTLLKSLVASNFTLI